VTPFQALGTALAPSIADAKTIISRRWLAAAAITLGTFLVAAYAVTVWHNLRAVVWIEDVSTFVLAAVFYADAMRLVLLPAYRLTFVNVLRLIAVHLVFLVSAVIVFIPFANIISVGHMNPHLVGFCFAIVDVLLGARLAFSWFALNNYGIVGACLRSWALTARPTFLPTLLVYAGSYVPSVIAKQVAGGLQTHLAPLPCTALSVVLDYAVIFPVGAFIFPLLARWMLECEPFHSPTESLAPLIR
jgi:hypothetical protein